MESIVKTIIKEKQPFERLEVSKEDLLEMFKVIILLYINLIDVFKSIPNKFSFMKTTSYLKYCFLKLLFEISFIHLF